MCIFYIDDAPARVNCHEGAAVEICVSSYIVEEESTSFHMGNKTLDEKQAPTGVTAVQNQKL